MSNEFTKIQTQNEQLQNFLKQLGLPQSLHSLTAAQEIPDALWAQIE